MIRSLAIKEDSPLHSNTAGTPKSRSYYKSSTISKLLLPLTVLFVALRAFADTPNLCSTQSEESQGNHDNTLAEVERARHDVAVENTEGSSVDLHRFRQILDSLHEIRSAYPSGEQTHGPPTFVRKKVLNHLIELRNTYEEKKKEFARHLVKSNPFRLFIPQGGRRYQEYINGTNTIEITQEMRQESDNTARKRREYVKRAMLHAWSGYKKYAFGADELLPLSNSPGSYWGGLGVTLVDSLDTLWLMGLYDEFWEARDWVRDELSFDNVGAVSVFEVTIRSLGGLLSAYDWSGDPIFLEKANDLGTRLLNAFESPNGMPYEQTYLNRCYSFNAPWQRNQVKIAEIGTLQLEFRYLSKVTKNPVFAEKVNHVLDLLAANQPDNGLYPLYVQNDILDIRLNMQSKSTLGGMGDSFYEYMLKTWIQGGKDESKYRIMYDKAMDGAHENLVQKSTPDGLTYVADFLGGHLDLKMDHLACFMGGLWALGAYTNPDGLHSPKAQRDLAHAKAITYTCYQMYARFPTGLAPEIARFDGNPKDQDFSPQVSTYLLRPETVESLFILNYLTGDPVYREWGWEIFQAIERFCRTDEGYCQISNVEDIHSLRMDKMESFFLAETLKYLYLLFDPDTKVDILNTHIFNTEAHPLRRFDRLE